MLIKDLCPIRTALLSGIILLGISIVHSIVKKEKKKKKFETFCQILFPVLLISLWALSVYAKPEWFVEFPERISFAFGLAITFALGTLIPLLFITAELGITIEEQWDELAQIPTGGIVTGYIERTLFFVALWYGNPLLIGGILTFKVAAKWEAWKNIVQVPQKHLNGFQSDDYHYFIFRKNWGSKLLNRFVLGTFGSILFALMGYGFYRWFLIVLDP